MAKAKWSLGKPSATVDKAGTATVSVPLLDSGVKQGDLSFTMSADRVLTVTWTAVAGAVGLSGFQAWSTE